MGTSRTKRKNLQKRRKRRLFAAISAEIRASEEAQWTPEKHELELMRNEEERQRTHEKWQKEVAKATAAFNRKKKIKEQRRQLVESLRQQMQQKSGDGGTL